jgi:hypothetical protein
MTLNNKNRPNLSSSKWLASIIFSLILTGCIAEPESTHLDNKEPVPRPGHAPYTAVTSQYSRLNVNPSTADHLDSDRFRIYYGKKTLSQESQDDVQDALIALESAYDFFVTQQGFRSPSVSILSNDSAHLKMNIYARKSGPAKGFTNWSRPAGLSYIDMHQGDVTERRLINYIPILVHEFGHTITYSEYNWVDQQRTDAWWEAIAEWFDVTFRSSEQYRGLALQLNQPVELPEVDFSVTIAQSHLTLVHQDNNYQAWPFFVYLTNNPDNYANLGPSAIQQLFHQYARNNETPLHTLKRLIAPITVAKIIGRYWARMAYIDIGLEHEKTRFLAEREVQLLDDETFNVWDKIADGEYQIKSHKQPMYAGANIVPLITTANNISVKISNLGNGLPDSNFTATLCLRNKNSNEIRYLSIPQGELKTTIATNEEAILVIVNTPDNLYQYDAYAAQEGDKSVTGLNYRVNLQGAEPIAQPSTASD